MKQILLCSLISFSFTASAALDVRAVVAEIERLKCESALDGSGEVLVVVGLGNHGYNGTRHNVGTDLVSQIAASLDSAIQEVPEEWLTYQAKDEADAQDYVDFSAASNPRREGLLVHYRVGGGYSVPAVNHKMIFVHPYYDINESGYMIQALFQEAQLRPEQILVVVDDLTLARNQIVLSVGKADGTGDGHNGLKSINNLLGTGAYTRLRVGVSNPKSEKLEISRTDWVLGQLSTEDRAALFSDVRLQNFVSLLSNIQSRIGLDAKTAQKVVAQGNLLLKKLNEK